MENIEFASQILTWLTWIVTKINSVISWIATPIAEKTSVEVQNVHLILLIGISVYLSSKITDDKGMKMIIIAAVIFSIFWTLGGGI